MKILVTGGAGFIGANFIHHILEKYPDYKVVNLDVLTYAGNLANLKSVEKNPNYEFVKGDILDKNLVNDLASKVDVVVHFAAESHVDRSILDSDSFVRTSVLGTLNLLEACKNNGNKRFHHISTDEVFGSLSKTDPAFNEKTPYDPRSPYSALMGCMLLAVGVRQSYAKATAEAELIKQYEFMGRIFHNARRRLDEAEDDAARRAILKAMGDAALDEHAQWILMNRERSVGQEDIVRLS